MSLIFFLLDNPLLSFNRLYFLILLTFCISIQNVSSQIIDSVFEFKQYHGKEGLSHNRVNTIIADSVGFIWVGTKDGLNRFDGHDFLNYTLNQDGTSRTASSNISILNIDMYDRFWVGTDMGLEEYDYIHDEYIHWNIHQGFNGILDTTILSIIPIEEEEYLIGTLSGLYSIDFSRQKWHPLMYNGLNIICNSLFKDVEGTVWFGTENGLFRYSVNGELELELSEYDGRILFITQITQDYKGRLWLATEDNGILVLEYNEEQVTKSFQFINPLLSNYDITCLVWEDSLHIWAGTNWGLNRICINEELGYSEVNQFFRDYDNVNSISRNEIACGYSDPFGRIWFGTYYAGINMLGENKLFNNRILNDQNKGRPFVTDFVEIANSFWISTDGDGIIVLDNEYKQSARYSTSDKSTSKLSNNKVISLLYDPVEESIWAGTWGNGIDIISIHTGKVHNLANRQGVETSLSSDYVFDIYLDRKNNIWVSTWYGSFSKYDRSNKSFENFYPDELLPNSNISNIVKWVREDSHENKWIGTQRHGLIRQDGRTGNYDLFSAGVMGNKRLSSNSIRCITEDHMGRIWIGTQDGLNIFFNDNRAINQLGLLDGLDDTIIESILVTGENEIWMSTNEGLIRSVFSGGYDDFNIFFTNYDEDYGIIISDFTTHASYFNKQDSTAYFGSYGGYVYFNPESINDIEINPKVYLTGLNIFLDDFSIQGAKNVLDSNIVIDKHIELSYRQKAFEIEYCIIDFLEPEDIYYSYKVHPFESEWNMVKNLRKARYTNLDPGEYTFIIRASRDPRKWEGHERRLDIIIQTPWWDTFLAKVGLLLMVVLVSVLFYKVKTHSIKKKKKELEETVRLKTKDLSYALKSLQLQKEKIQEKNKELNAQNEEISPQNEEISTQNKQITVQKEEIDRVNKKLKDALRNLEDINHNLEKIVRERTKHLATANRELDQFIYSASQELSGPIETISILISTARNTENPNQVKEQLDHIGNSISSLESTVGNLSNYCDNQKLKGKSRAVDFDNVLNEIIIENISIIDEYHIRVEKDYKENTMLSTDLFRIKI